MLHGNNINAIILPPRLIVTLKNVLMQITLC